MSCIAWSAVRRAVPQGGAEGAPSEERGAEGVPKRGTPFLPIACGLRAKPLETQGNGGVTKMVTGKAGSDKVCHLADFATP